VRVFFFDLFHQLSSFSASGFAADASGDAGALTVGAVVAGAVASGAGAAGAVVDCDGVSGADVVDAVAVVGVGPATGGGITTVRVLFFDLFHQLSRSSSSGGAAAAGVVDETAVAGATADVVAGVDPVAGTTEVVAGADASPGAATAACADVSSFERKSQKLRCFFLELAAGAAAVAAGKEAGVFAGAGDATARFCGMRTGAFRSALAMCGGVACST
jgi:hypothetical protein